MKETPVKSTTAATALFKWIIANDESDLKKDKDKIRIDRKNLILYFHDLLEIEKDQFIQFGEIIENHLIDLQEVGEQPNKKVDQFFNEIFNSND